MKNFIKALIPLSVVATAAYAGGIEAPPPAPCVTPFIDIMGGGAWRDNSTPSITSVTVPTIEPIVLGLLANTTYTNTFRTSEDNWMVRGAVGLMFPYNPAVSLTTEVGWGYYGEDTVNHFNAISFVPTTTGALLGLPTTTVAQQVSHSTFSYNGFDVLIGAMYSFNPNFSVYGKVGGLVLNQRRDANFFGLTTVNVLTGLPVLAAVGSTGGVVNDNDRTNTEVLPEVMVGAMYNFNPMFGIFVNYMHAFGDTFLSFPGHATGSGVLVAPGVGGVSFAGLPLVSTGRINENLPSLNAVMGGIEVRFPAV